MPEEKMSPQSHIYVDLDESQTGPRPSDTCGEPANNWDKPAADAGPRQPRTYRIVDKSIAGSDERTQFLQSPPVPQEAAPRCPFGYTKEQPGTKHECAIHKFSDYAATAPDSAMRVAKEIIKLAFWDTGKLRDSEIAALIRQAGSERERELRKGLYNLRCEIAGWLGMARPMLVQELSFTNVRVMEDRIAETDRLLGGE